MRILVTGGAGMIGSNLVRRLLYDGHEVNVVDNLWRGSIENLQGKGFERFSIQRHFHLCDLSEFGDWVELFKGIDVVYHLADVVAGIGFVFRNEGFIFRKNIMINSNVFTAVRMFTPKRLIYVGTACSFPRHLQSGVDSRPLREEDQYPADPESAYGWSKLMGEYEALLLEKEKVCEVVILSLHNVYGTPCDYRSERSQVIPSLVNRALLSNSDTIEVWGSGEQGRAFVYVDDVIDALGSALKNGAGEGVIQIGPNSCTSIKELSMKIVALVGTGKRLAFDRTKPEGDRGRSADYSKAKSLLEWSPRVSLDDGLRKVVAWITEKEQVG